MILTSVKAACEILCVAMRTVLLLAGTAFIMGLVFMGENDPGRDRATSDSDSRTRLGKDDHNGLIISVKDDKENNFSRFVLRDRAGYPLMKGELYQDKRIIFSMGDESDGSLVRSVGHTSTAGEICLGVRNGKSQYKILACNDGSSVVELVELNTNVLHRFQITPQGDFVADLPLVLGGE